MLKQLMLTIVVGLLAVGVASAVYAGGCGCGHSGGATADGTVSQGATTGAVQSAPAIAGRTGRTYRVYSYQPSYSGRGSSRSMSRGSSGGFRDAASKSTGRYGR